MIWESFTRTAHLSYSSSASVPDPNTRDDDTGSHQTHTAWNSRFEELRKQQEILFWLTLHPGSDAEDVAHALRLPELEAVVLVQDMLRAGVLDFSE